MGNSEEFAWEDYMFLDLHQAAEFVELLPTFFKND